jgi:hypothetical protein
MTVFTPVLGSPSPLRSKVSRQKNMIDPICRFSAGKGEVARTLSHLTTDRTDVEVPFWEYLHAMHFRHPNQFNSCIGLRPCLSQHERITNGIASKTFSRDPIFRLGSPEVSPILLFPEPCFLRHRIDSQALTHLSADDVC